MRRAGPSSLCHCGVSCALVLGQCYRMTLYMLNTVLLDLDLLDGIQRYEPLTAVWIDKSGRNVDKGRF